MAPPRQSPARKALSLASSDPEPEIQAVSIRGNFSGREGFAHTRMEKKALAAAPSLAVKEREEFEHEMQRHDPEVILTGDRVWSRKSGASGRGCRGGGLGRYHGGVRWVLRVVQFAQDAVHMRYCRLYSYDGKCTVVHLCI